MERPDATIDQLARVLESSRLGRERREGRRSAADVRATIEERVSRRREERRSADRLAGPVEGRRRRREGASRLSRREEGRQERAVLPVRGQRRRRAQGVRHGRFRRRSVSLSDGGLFRAESADYEPPSRAEVSLPRAAEVGADEIFQGRSGRGGEGRGSDGGDAGHVRFGHSPSRSLGDDGTRAMGGVRVVSREASTDPDEADHSLRNKKILLIGKKVSGVRTINVWVPC
mmetsp:Transcript_59867/g.177451  ORF Transcript_59867/g.177451 Transcript_59867/m.177451 type:complete len:230 (-) Transcript_59867:30-719(-)